jgi:predicted RNase H-like nuclease (RuvC/YqgF family)
MKLSLKVMDMLAHATEKLLKENEKLEGEVFRLKKERERLKKELKLISSAKIRGFGIDYVTALADGVLKHMECFDNED